MVLHVEWSWGEWYSTLIGLPWQRKLEEQSMVWRSVWWDTDVPWGLVVLIEKTGNDWNVCSYQIFSLQWKKNGGVGFGRAPKPISFCSVIENDFHIQKSRLMWVKSTHFFWTQDDRKKQQQSCINYVLPLEPTNGISHFFSSLVFFYDNKFQEALPFFFFF